MCLIGLLVAGIPVADAVDTVVREVCPYFERLAGEFGCILPWQVEADNVDKGADL